MDIKLLIHTEGDSRSETHVDIFKKLEFKFFKRVISHYNGLTIYKGSRSRATGKKTSMV
jgi:hypothetical protein